MIALREPFSAQANRIEELLQEAVSSSRLGCWLQCRLKYFFKYVMGESEPTQPNLHLGKTVHAVLQEWNQARWNGQILSVEDLEQHYDVFFDEGDTVDWNSPEQRRDNKDRGRALLATYLEHTNIPFLEKPQGVEVYAEADLSRHGLPSLCGVIDLVRPGGIIVDFKTSSQAPYSSMVLHTHGIQLTSYGVLYRDATGEKESGLELHHLVKLKKPKVVITQAEPVTKKAVARLFRTLESYVDGVQREDFVPSPGLACAYCPFFKQCRKWEGGSNAS